MKEKSNEPRFAALHPIGTTVDSSGQKTILLEGVTSSEQATQELPQVIESSLGGHVKAGIICSTTVGGRNRSVGFAGIDWSHPKASPYMANLNSPRFRPKPFVGGPEGD